MARVDTQQVLLFFPQTLLISPAEFNINESRYFITSFILLRSSLVAHYKAALSMNDTMAYTSDASVKQDCKSATHYSATIVDLITQHQYTDTATSYDILFNLATRVRKCKSFLIHKFLEVPHHTEEAPISGKAPLLRSKIYKSIPGIGRPFP